MPRAPIRPAHAPAVWRAAAGLAALLCAASPGVAAAISRLSFELAGPGDVYVDGQALTPGAGRLLAPAVSPGRHKVTVRTPSGSRDTWLDVADRAQVTIKVGIDGSLAVMTGGATVAAGPGGPAGPATAAGPGEAPPEEAAATSFDMNEGATGAVGPGEEGPAGDYSGWSRTVGTAGRAVGGVVAPGVGPVAGTVGSAAVYGAASLVRNAEAGGLNDLRGGPPAGRQGRPVMPKAVTGAVTFQAAEGDAYIVYADGMEVARVAGGGKAQVRLEVGRRELELWDADTGAARWKGVLTVEEAAGITLRLDDDQPPVAVERSWLWSGR
jgi:hypothetical protein